MPPPTMVVGLKLVNSFAGDPNIAVAVSTKKGNRNFCFKVLKFEGMNFV